jgi:hypothetical protein
MQTLGAGRDLDREIAEKVMGWEWTELDWANPEHRHLVPGGIPQQITVPHYSSDIAAAFAVLSAVSAKGYQWALANSEEGFDVWIGRKAVDDLVAFPDVRAETAPLAICLAALKAMEEK